MQPGQFFMVVVVMILVLAWYQNHKLRNQVLCEYTRINGQEIEKFVKMSAHNVIFDGKKFDIVPWCAKLFWYDRGLINKLFPTWVIKFSYTHYSELPIDPKTGTPAVLSPGVRKIIDKEETMGAFAKHIREQGGGGKQGILQKYGVYVCLIGIVAIGFMWYQNQQSTNANLSAIFNYLKLAPPHP